MEGFSGSITLSSISHRKIIWTLMIFIKSMVIPVFTKRKSRKWTRFRQKNWRLRLCVIIIRGKCWEIFKMREIWMWKISKMVSIISMEMQFQYSLLSYRNCQSKIITGWINFATIWSLVEKLNYLWNNMRKTGIQNCSRHWQIPSCAQTGKKWRKKETWVM